VHEQLTIDSTHWWVKIIEMLQQTGMGRF